MTDKKSTLAPSKNENGDLITKLYAVYDKKVEGFVYPQFHINDAVATRSFSVACSTPDTMFNQCPDDFSLVCLGTLNQDTGDLVGGTSDPVVTARYCVDQFNAAMADAT